MPSLVGKDIDGIQATLGRPTEEDTAEHYSDGNDERFKAWGEFNSDLMVTFHSRSRRVVDFFIGPHDPSGCTSDKGRLLALGNLRGGDPQYSIEFVAAIGNPGQFTGVKVIPK